MRLLVRLGDVAILEMDRDAEGVELERAVAVAVRRQGAVAERRVTVDLEELPGDLRESMTFVPVQTLDEVLKVAF